MNLSEAVCDGRELRCFSWAADQKEDDRERTELWNRALNIVSWDLQVVDVWRDGRPIEEALYVRERCLTASRQGSSSSWKRGVPVISAASGRSLGLNDSMLRTILSYTQTENRNRSNMLIHGTITHIHSNGTHTHNFQLQLVQTKSFSFLGLGSLRFEPLGVSREPLTS